MEDVTDVRDSRGPGEESVTGGTGSFGVVKRPDVPEGVSVTSETKGRPGVGVRDWEGPVRPQGGRTHFFEDGLVS